MEQLRDALERAKAGDIDGFAFLVERFQDMAVGYSYAVLGDFHLAEDAAQEAFMEAYPNLHKVYGPEAFPSWLRRVVFKHCDRIRRRKTLSTTQVLEIGPSRRAPEFVQSVLDDGDWVMGFGHPVYRTTDPRAACLAPEAKVLSDRKGRPAWFSTLEAVVKAMEPYAKKGIGPNVDLWSAAIYRLLGIPEEMFSSLFAIGRVPGWVAHVAEQEAVGVLLRPRLLYDGPVDLPYTPIERRG